MVFARDHFQPVGFRNGVFSSVRLEIADNDVLALSFELLRFLEHAIGFAHARRITEK